MSGTEYLFHKNQEDLSAALVDKMKRLETFWRSSPILNRARRSYFCYYNQYFRGSDGTRTANVGEQGEMVGFSVNHLRNLLQHTMALVLQNRLSFDVQAEATDMEARNACLIGSELLDQGFYAQRIEHQIRSAVELGLIMGTSFLAAEWKPFVKLRGQDADGNPVYSGAPSIKSYTMFEVALEPFKDNFDEQLWVVLRDVKNRYEVSAVYPEFKDKIEDQPPLHELSSIDPMYTSNEDHLALYRAYHRESPSLPGGRYTVFLQDGTVLEDGPNPYVSPDFQTPNGGIPVFCFRPSMKYMSAYGHTIAYELMQSQEILNMLDSSIASNQNAFGVQNIIAVRGSGVKDTDLSGGLKLVEYDYQEGVPNGGAPAVMQLCATPQEIFQYRQSVIGDMEVLSGINSVIRGNPQASLLSGAALAVVATQANVFSSNFEAAYIGLVEDVALWYLYLLARFQTEEDMIALVGAGKMNEVRKFKGVNLLPIRKVKVTVGNPLAKTTAGRMELADKLVSTQMLKDPNDYLDVVRTGNINRPLDEATAQKSYIMAENEQMLRGEVPIVAALDNPQMHMTAHQILLWNPEVRNTPKLRAAVEQHLTDHLNQFEQMATGNPMMMALAMGLPIPMPVPAPDTGIGPNATAPAAPPNGAPTSAIPESDAKAMANQPSASSNLEPTMQNKAVEAMDNAKRSMLTAEGGTPQ